MLRQVHGFLQGMLSIFQAITAWCDTDFQVQDLPLWKTVSGLLPRSQNSRCPVLPLRQSPDSKAVIPALFLALLLDYLRQALLDQILPAKNIAVDK